MYIIFFFLNEKKKHTSRQCYVKMFNFNIWVCFGNNLANCFGEGVLIYCLHINGVNFSCLFFFAVCPCNLQRSRYVFLVLIVSSSSVVFGDQYGIWNLFIFVRHYVLQYRALSRMVGWITV